MVVMLAVNVDIEGRVCDEDTVGVWGPLVAGSHGRCVSVASMVDCSRYACQCGKRKGMVFLNERPDTDSRIDQIRAHLSHVPRTGRQVVRWVELSV